MNDNKIEERDLVWLPKRLAEKIKDNTDKKLEEKLIVDYLDQSRSDVKANLESLDEDILRYKGLMAKARQAFREAKEEQLQANYDLWEKFDKELPKLSEKVEMLKNKVEPIKRQVQELNESLDKVRSYQIKDLVDLLKEISDALSYDSNTGKILKFLVKNYKSD